MTWPVVKLGTLASFRNGVNFTKSSFGTGVRVINVADFKDRRKPDYESLGEINPDGVVREDDLLRDKDILFVRSNGNRELIGRSMFIEEPSSKVTYSAFCIRARFTSPKVVPRFYAYLFRAPLLRRVLSSRGSGTNISNLNQTILGRLEVPCPSIDQQQRVIALISRYDALIDNNERRITLLEDASRQLYGEWFSRLRFPGYERTKILGSLPKEWSMRPLSSLAEINAHTVPSSFDDQIEYVDISTVSTGRIGQPSVYDYHSAPGRAKRVVRHGDIIWSCVRPNRRAHAIVWNPRPNVIVSTGFAVISPVALPTSYLYQATTSASFVGYLENRAKGVAYPAVVAKDASSAEFVGEFWLR